MKLTRKMIVEMTANGIEAPGIEDTNDVLEFCTELITYINESENCFWAAFESPDTYVGNVVIDAGHKSALRVMVAPGQINFLLGDCGLVSEVAFASIGVIIFTMGYFGIKLDLSGLSVTNPIPEGGKSFIDENDKTYDDPTEFDWI